MTDNSTEVLRETAFQPSLGKKILRRGSVAGDNHAHCDKKLVRAVLHRPERLRSIARELQLEADRLLREAEDIEASKDDEARIEARGRAIRRAALAVAHGGDVVCEAQQLARALEMSPGDARATIMAYVPLRRTRERIERNREILRLARIGWSNGELGKRFGLSKGHITRIVQGALKSSRGLMGTGL